MMFSVNSSVLKGATWRDARWTIALRNWGGHAATLIARFRALAPYALMELVLPGGSVMALLLWLYRRRKNGVGFGQLPVRLLSLLASWSTYATMSRTLRMAACDREARPVIRIGVSRTQRALRTL
jgi:hypothetical protein